MAMAPYATTPQVCYITLSFIAISREIQNWVRGQLTYVYDMTPQVAATVTYYILHVNFVIVITSETCITQLAELMTLVTVMC